MNTPPAFVIADNQDIARAGLHGYAAALSPQSRVVDVHGKQELVAALAKSPEAAVVVLDYARFDLKSLDELLVLAARFSMCRWVMFSDEPGEDLMRCLSAEPAFSIVLKDDSDAEIRAALRQALCGGRYLCRQVEDFLQTKAEQRETAVLTAAETDVLRHIAAGRTVKEIAALRFSSTHTIVTHKKNLFRKLGVNNVHEATRYALRAGIVEMMEYYI